LTKFINSVPVIPAITKENQGGAGSFSTIHMPNNEDIMKSMFWISTVTPNLKMRAAVNTKTTLLSHSLWIYEKNNIKTRAKFGLTFPIKTMLGRSS